MASTFVTNLTGYLNDNLGIAGNLINCWTTATTKGEQMQIAGAVAVLSLEHTASAVIDDGASINQDTSFSVGTQQVSLRTGKQQVAVTADAENDMVNITGNFGMPGLKPERAEVMGAQS